MNETLQISDGRTVLRMERRLRHRPEKVWRAVTEPPHLKHWFPFDVEVDLRPGGEIRFIERNPGDGPTLTGVVTDVDRPRLFAFTWGDDNTLRFDLRPDGEGCLLVFTHSFTDHFGAASFTAGWEVCFDAMEAELDGRPFEPPGDMAEAHDNYVAALGLDEGSVEDTGDGWRIRFERQLTRPGDTVWATLSADGTPGVGEPPPPALTADAVTAGTVTACEPQKLVEYDWLADGRPAGKVRWELDHSGTGQGARLVLIQTGPAEMADVTSGASSAWKARIARLAEQLRSTPPASP